MAKREVVEVGDDPLAGLFDFDDSSDLVKPKKVTPKNKTSTLVTPDFSNRGPKKIEKDEVKVETAKVPTVVEKPKDAPGLSGDMFSLTPTTVTANDVQSKFQTLSAEEEAGEDLFGDEYPDLKPSSNILDSITEVEVSADPRVKSEVVGMGLAVTPLGDGLFSKNNETTVNEDIDDLFVSSMISRSEDNTGGLLETSTSNSSRKS